MKIIQKKRVIALLLVVVLVLSFASCGRKKQNDTTAPITNPPTPVETEPPVTEPAETDPPETEQQIRLYMVLLILLQAFTTLSMIV